MPGGQEDAGPPASVMGIVITTLTYDDLLAIQQKENVPNLEAVIGSVKGVSNLSWQGHNYDTNLNGTTHSYMDVEGGKLAAGRFFTIEEERNLSRVIVLGSVVKEELFGSSDAVGKRIKVKKQSFEVIGVMKERGSVAFQDYDDQTFIPLKTMQKLIAGVNYLSMIRGKADSEENTDKVITDIEMLLRDRHDIKDMTGKNDDFTVGSTAEVLKALGSITDALKYFLMMMAALSLLVGGIGIMNIMLISVKERTREIGLRKALGANQARIVKQFLSETVCLTVLGGMVGLSLGVLISWLISLGIVHAGYDWHFIISSSSVILALVVSVSVGLIFGIYPAFKASRLEPVEALRYE
jgi:putative ABC transport system permease protein